MSAKRNRYAQMQQYMIYILLGDLLMFVLYLIGAGNGIIWLKALCAVLTIIASSLCLGYLFLTQELFRKRSLWMTIAAGAVIACILFSLILNFPCPAPTPENIPIKF